MAYDPPYLLPILSIDESFLRKLNYINELHRMLMNDMVYVDVLGMIVEYDCRSFIEFVCRLSLEPHADPNEPGTEPTIHVIREAQLNYTGFRLQRIMAY